MSDRLLDQLELGARAAQSLVTDNELSPTARHTALCWRAAAVVVPVRRPVPTPAEAPFTLCRAA